jgi:CHAD domain-containing protein
MKALEVPPRNLLAVYDDALSKVSKGLARFVERRSFDDVHDVRASIRRLDIAFALLPKTLRTDRLMKAYFRKLDRFYKLSTRATDLEVVRRELSALSRIADPDGASANQAREGRHLDREMQRLAKNILDRGPPPFRRLDISKSKLTRRWSRVMKETTRRMDKDYPDVVSDPAKVEELHRLRRDSRRLRYLLSFVEQSREVSDLGRLLIEVQDALGAIRDCDATIRLLGTSGRQTVNRRLSRRVRSKRAALYTEFVAVFPRKLEKHLPFVGLT